MISGYNTDIEYNGVVYHVQTEDKGPAMPMILSLVYDKGTILASKRAPYELGQGDAGEDAIAERLQRQHKLICAAVMAGRIEDLKRMSAAAREHRRTEAEKTTTPDGFGHADLPKEENVLHISAAPPAGNRIEPEIAQSSESEAPIPMPERLPPLTPAVLEETELTVLDDVQVLEEYSFLSPEDLKIVSDLAGQVRPEHDNLSIEFVGSPDFRSGRTIATFILVCRGSRREVMRGSEILVKIMGSAFRPVVYHAVSDKNGLAQISLNVPHFSSGRAMVVARAKSGSDEVEVRRPVMFG